MSAVATARKPRPAKDDAPAAMRLTVDRSPLLKVLGHAAAIVERRNTIPILSNVLLEAVGEELRLTSTDLNLQLALTVPANVQGESSITVSAAMLHQIVREFAEGSQVELKLDESRLQVNSGRSRYKLQTLPRDQFPVLEMKGAHSSFAVPACDVIRSLIRVAFAQDTDSIVRPHFCGVNVEIVGGELFFVATDGKRIAWSKVQAPDGAELASVILSTKLVSIIPKLLDGHEGEVRLSFDERKVKIEVGGAVLIGKLVEGTYPPWRRILPTDEGRKLIVAADALEGAVRRAALIQSERQRAVKIELSTDKLTVSAKSQANGTAVEEAPAVWEGGDFSSGFSARFLLDVLAVAGDVELHIDLHGEGMQLLAVISDPGDASAGWLLAPMAV